MSVFLQPIYTQTVGAGGAGGITFNNIPQTFTDLKIVYSVRAARTSQTWDAIGLQFNSNSSAIYSSRLIYASPSGANSNYNSNSNTFSFIQYASTAAATANTFGNGEVYIPNYTSANFKQVLGDSVAETNGNSDWLMALSAGLWQSTTAITSLNTFPLSGGNFAQYSTVSLYGVLRAGI
jgi:hypothetical protein